MTTFANPWNEVYKLAALKIINNTKITTHRKTDGSLTAAIRESVMLMLQYFTPEDNKYDDNDYHKKVRS